MDHEAIKVQQSLVALRQKMRKAERPHEREIPKSLRTLKTLELSDRSEILSTTLAKEVRQLKARKNELIDQEETRKNELTRKRSTLFESNQQLWTKAKKLDAEKVMLLQEYNKYETFLSSIEAQGKRTIREPMRHAETQTDETAHLLQLRRDYAGVLGKNRFDDRTSVLLDRFNTKVLKAVGYENEKGFLVAVRFSYFLDGKPDEQFEGGTAVPQAYLLKCKQKLA